MTVDCRLRIAGVTSPTARGTVGTAARRRTNAPTVAGFVLALCLHSALDIRPSEGAELRTRQLTVQVARDGAGFIDAVRFGGQSVVSAPKGFAGAAVALTDAGDGTAASLFAHRATATLRPVLRNVQTDSGAVIVAGSYTDGTTSVPLTRRIRAGAGGATLEVTEEVDFTALPARYALASHELHLPLVLAKDPHVRMFGFGGAGRAELFRMDMNDINRGGKQLISAPRGHWPYWDVAGVLQLPGSHRIWKANHADTMAYPVSEGKGAPGWADYSQLDWGVTAVVDEAGKSAPWAIRIDARRGVLTLAAHPASQLPASGKQLGRRTFRFRLTFHEKSWPATIPCELPFGRYRQLLEALAVGSRGTKQPYVLHSPIGTSDPDTIIFRERLQPSVVLRTLYRGDAWRMQGRMKAVGQTVPRNQPFADWEKAARWYLDHIRTHGVPQRSP